MSKSLSPYFLKRYLKFDFIFTNSYVYVSPYFLKRYLKFDFMFTNLYVYVSLLYVEMIHPQSAQESKIDIPDAV